MKNNIIIACSKIWFIKNKQVKNFFKKNKNRFFIIHKKKDLNLYRI